MTGIGGLVFLPTNGRRSFWRRLRAYIRAVRGQRRGLPGRFILLCHRRTGSNWVSGMLFNHPELLMHNEVFNENAVHSYYKSSFLSHAWDYEGRDVNPSGFVTFIFDVVYRLVDKFRDEPERCKMVGFKSFPNHYLQHGVPHATLSREYAELMSDPSVKKLILMRENVPKVYVSSRRSYEQDIFLTEKYNHKPIHVDVADLQHFAHEYAKSYEEYDMLLRGQGHYKLFYEELCADADKKMRAALRFLGVSDNVSMNALVETVPQSSGPLARAIVNYSEVEFAFRHTLLAEFLPPARREAGGPPTPMASIRTTDGFETLPAHRWGLIIPLRSGESTKAECETRLTSLRDSLLDTASSVDKLPLLVFGVDDDDVLYLHGGSALIRRLFCQFPMHVETLNATNHANTVYRGAICKIWARLAGIAYEQFSCDFTCLLGDDIVLETNGWQLIIERAFSAVAEERNLPFGCACVAFHDTAFRGFPTFPVVHRWHHVTFGKRLLPSHFVNQGGDPYLFELYKRFGAARFADAALKNTIGGADEARYTKQRLRFEDDILTDGIQVVKAALNRRSLICLDVVVPTFRCDLAGLRRITELRASWDAQVSFWIILDNPTHPAAAEVRALQTVASNYQVNVRCHPENRGASAARNFGLGHSKADWVVLLDDDVTPEAHILDAYLGACMRVPHASAFVGATHMPPPHNWLTHAIVASDIPGAFTIAEKVSEPPWGVTANLCVRGRTSRLRFDLRYPKTGGGEDLDYCAKARRHGPIVSVPLATAHHPWWNGGELCAVRHILAWADGEVLCVGAPELRPHVFLTLPNGVEFLHLVLPLLLAVARALGQLEAHRAVAIGGALLMAILVCDMLWHASGIGPHRFREPMSASWWRRVAVRLLAAGLIMLQERQRFVEALRRSPTWLFWRVDWHFGQSHAFIEGFKRGHVTRFVVYAAMATALLYWESPRSGEECLAPTLSAASLHTA